MLSPVPTRFPFLDTEGPIAFAHRGAAPGLENTLAAVDRVVALGFGYLETDVRVTRDGVEAGVVGAMVSTSVPGKVIVF